MRNLIFLISETHRNFCEYTFWCSVSVTSAIGTRFWNQVKPQLLQQKLRNAISSRKKKVIAKGRHVEVLHSK